MHTHKSEADRIGVAIELQPVKRLGNFKFLIKFVILELGSLAW